MLCAVPLEKKYDWEVAAASMFRRVLGAAKCHVAAAAVLVPVFFLLWLWKSQALSRLNTELQRLAQNKQIQVLQAIVK